MFVEGVPDLAFLREFVWEWGDSWWGEDDSCGGDVEVVFRFFSKLGDGCGYGDVSGGVGDKRGGFFWY